MTLQETINNQDDITLKSVAIRDNLKTKSHVNFIMNIGCVRKLKSRTKNQKANTIRLMSNDHIPLKSYTLPTKNFNIMKNYNIEYEYF